MPGVIIALDICMALTPTPSMLAVAVLWAVVNELLIQPREYTAFNLSLQKLRDDPRIMVMIGTPVSGYGQETHSRAARQRIPHKVYSDDSGREHVQVKCAAF